LIEKCSFLVSCQFNTKSGAIDQLTIGDRPVDRDRLVGHPCFSVSKRSEAHVSTSLSLRT